MTPFNPRSALETHEVSNQPAPRGDIDLWENDAPLREAVEREGGGGHVERLARYGAELGRAETREDGRLANRHPPELRAFDRAGRRLDEVAFHPAYHGMLRRGVEAGYVSAAWDGSAPGGHVAHAAMVYLASQVEPGACCPMTMTYAVLPALEADPDIAEAWRPLLLSERYDSRSLPAGVKDGALFGMAMTEKQGGSDVRANTTIAEPDDGAYRLTGHKWFCSAPMSDAFLTLAQAPDGLTCFLVPRWTPDGARNPLQLMRLKDKLGNRSNASAEIEYSKTWAARLGAEGDGVRTIIEMVRHTRLDTAMAPAGLMRAALSEAAWWCRERAVFQRKLIDQPLMQAVLADLALELEGALALGMRVARAFDEGASDPVARSFARIAVSLAKYWANKRCPNLVYEAMECLGGAGYVEESPLPMLYREAPLNSIWEGSGNVICLDVLRTLDRDDIAADAIWHELDPLRGQDARIDAELDAAQKRWPAGPEEREARWFVETLARLLQGALLARSGSPAVAEAYLATRFNGDRGATAGAMRGGIDAEAILARL